MAQSKIKIYSKDQIDLLDFSDSFGDISPLAAFLGPKKPSNRQILRNFLHWVIQGKPLKESATEVVLAVVLKHPGEENLKNPKYLADDVIKIYKEARCFNCSGDHFARCCC